MVPKKIFFTKGCGIHREKLQAFELALRRAGIEKYNLVHVSSILPPGCKVTSPRKGLALLSPGEIVYVVLSSISTNEPYRLISASIGMAVPAEQDHYGYISEHSAYGEGREQAADHAEDLAASMLASTLGIDFNPDDAYDERREIYRMSGKIVEARSTTQIARGDKNGRWTTAVAAGVFIC